jgi:starch synthase (maltosyl-transferring)
MTKGIFIEAVSPAVDEGRFPAKAVAGRPCRVEADIFRDGHVVLRAVVKWRREKDRAFREVAMVSTFNDRWYAKLPLKENTRYVFAIEAWTDHYTTWLEDLTKRVGAGQDVSSEALEGATLLEIYSRHARGKAQAELETAAKALKRKARAAKDVLAAASAPALLKLVARHQPRVDAVTTPTLFGIVADRPLALFGAWYEMFPRSQGKTPGKASTFREAERRLPEIQDMGFDVIYLPPIHPVGRRFRKGRNNTLVAKKGDPGSPWAIGSKAGGHMAVDPNLGTLDDFDHFARTANGLGMEVALDFAIQCSPDHPWVKKHPEWFHHRPDGTIKYAENPPKKYQDIYPINFDTPDREGLWEELLRTLLFWIEHGVRVFRVDNPHTKPLPFWHWLIGGIQERHPDIIFLSEAFTRPKMMKALAKVGFTQSYTYFTWRNEKGELTEYLRELTGTEMAHYFRPNFFANTPDILHEVLQKGGRPAFRMRLVLAATLSPSYGIYSGFELCEDQAVPGTEEYINSEKYEIKVRDWNAPGNIKEEIARINTIRRENPALQELTNLHFLDTDNDRILFYAKLTEDKRNVLLIAVNLDPTAPHHCTAWVPPNLIGVKAGGRYDVHDLISGATYRWGERNYVRLDPQVEPAHILRLEKRLP